MDPHVVIVGGGFGGLYAARKLAHRPVRVTLVDRQNYHLFQPLLYQVATAGLSPSDVASPIRSLLAGVENVETQMAEVTRIDLAHRTVAMQGADTLTYDYLVLATGVRHSYFGNEGWEAYAPGLKTLDDALELRRRVLTAFERAEREPDTLKKKGHLTFVVVGAGPTGVEMAGAIAEFARFTVARDFRNFDPTQARVILLDAGPRVLPGFDPFLSAKAAQTLRELHVDVRLDTKVVQVRYDGVRTESGFIEADTVVWAAGVAAEPFTQSLGVALDRAGRIRVNPDLTIPGHPEAFAVGDLMVLEQEPGKLLPGLAQVAIQSGEQAARNILLKIRGKPTEAFRYFDKGMMATVGRASGVAQTGPLKLWGWVGWLAWLFVHLVYLIGFRNRLVVLVQWAAAYFTYGRGARLITGTTPVPAAQEEVASLPVRERHHAQA